MLDDELPGMWEHADFTGGQESSSIVEEVAQAFEISEEDILKYLDTETPMLALKNCVDEDFVLFVESLFAPEDHTDTTPHSPYQIMKWWQQKP